jgi:hypothetical protein
VAISALPSRARVIIGVLVAGAFVLLPVLADAPARHAVPVADPARPAPAPVVTAAALQPTATRPPAAALSVQGYDVATEPATQLSARPTRATPVHRIVKPHKRVVRRHATAKPRKRVVHRHATAKPRKRAAHRRAVAKRHKKAVHRRAVAKRHKRVVHRAAKPRTRVVHRHAAARPRKPAVRRNGSNTVTVGHYIRSLRGTARDYRLMRTLGARDAARNLPHGRYLVLLDIGGQVRHGVRLSTTTRVISYPALVRAMRGYVSGYHLRQRADAPATIAIGTNNDLWVDTTAGRVWATGVVNPVAASARGYRGIVIAGANDIEPGFAGSPQQTRAWFKGYRAHTSAPFVFNGSADGCSWHRPYSRCNNGWTSRDIVQLAGLIAPGRTTVLPQIYNHAMVGQWLQLAREARLAHGRLNIVGPLTENRACGRDPYCPTMPTRHAWNALWTNLRKARLVSRPLPISVDLDVH